MIISVCGSQGQGKSTVLSSLIDDGYNVVTQKTARTVLNEMGLNLEQVYSNSNLAKLFHEIVYTRHLNSVQSHKDSKELFFIERSFADIFAYALIVLGPYNQHSNWLNDFYNKCKYGQALFSGIFYLSGVNIQPKDDSVRSTNQMFTSLVDMLIDKTLDEFSDNEDQPYPVFNIIHSNHDERMKYIKDVIKNGKFT